MAKIEILARPIEGFEFLDKYVPQHLYVVHTQDNGEQIAYRGGPEKGNYVKGIKGNPLRDNLKVTKLSYNKYHPDFPEEGQLHPSILVIEGTDQLINLYIERMEANPMKWINNSDFDYKTPLLGSWQNSNTAAHYLIEGAGLKFELPEHLDGIKVMAPAWGSKIHHTKLDRLKVGEKVWGFYDQLEESLVKLGKEGREKLEQIENYIKNFKSLEGDIENHKKANSYIPLLINFYEEQAKQEQNEEEENSAVVELADKYLNRLDEESEVMNAHEVVHNYIKGILLYAKNYSLKKEAASNLSISQSLYDEISRFFAELRKIAAEESECDEKLDKEIKDIINRIEVSSNNLFEYERMYGKTEEYWQKVYNAGENVIKHEYKNMMDICLRNREEGDRNECKNSLQEKEYKSLIIDDYGFDSCTTAHRYYKNIAEELDNGSICMSEKEGITPFYKHAKNLEKLGYNKNEIFPIVVCGAGLCDRESIESIEFKDEINKVPEHIKEMEIKYNLETHDEL